MRFLISQNEKLKFEFIYVWNTDREHRLQFTAAFDFLKKKKIKIK